MNTLPATLERFVLERDMIERSQQFLRERGLEGLEAVVLWLGRPLDERTGHAFVELIPHQVAYRGQDGEVWVEVPPESISEVIGLLPADLFVLIRVHSHPSKAYHSPVDDRNMLISHQGAISIVVPDFARGNFDLSRCSVNRLDHARGWVELSVREVEQMFAIR